jgi:cation diffusion facilitator family transporter
MSNPADNLSSHELRMQRRREKTTVALWSIGAAVFLITAKTVVGVMSGSLALLTDAVHSLLDMGASIITYFAVRISDKPADQDHQFGHGKIESLGALLQIIFLLGACAWITFEAVHRIQRQEFGVELNVWAFAVVISSIVIDYNRVRALRRVAVKYSSQALAADALHFTADIYVSSVVLFGLGAVQLGLPLADPLAAILVSLFIIFTAVRLARKSIDVLLDRAPSDAEVVIKETVALFPEILDIKNLRLRTDGRTTFAVLDLDVDRSLTFSRVDDLKSRLETELCRRLPQPDLTITLTPQSSGSEMVADSIRYVVSGFGLNLHHLIVRDDPTGYFASMHIEMPGDMTLEAAHAKATEITKKLHEAIARLAKVVIHTEPHHPGDAAQFPGEMELEETAARIKRIVESFSNVDDCHNIVLTPHGDGLALSADMRLDGDLPLERTHRISVDVEKKLRSELPELVSITLHLEPFKVGLKK